MGKKAMVMIETKRERQRERERKRYRRIGFLDKTNLTVLYCTVRYNTDSEWMRNGTVENGKMFGYIGR